MPEPRTATSRSPPGGRSSSRSPSAGRSCSSSKTSTGPTTACSTSSTTSRTGRAGVPLLVLCTARPELFERRPGWGGGKLNALTLALSPLSNARTPSTLLSLVLARTVLRSRDPADAARTCQRQPSLRRAVRAPLRSSAARSTTCRFPEGVQGLIAARLDSLPAEEKALLQDAAVMGKVFWSGALSVNGARLERLHALERKEFIRRERRSSVAGEDEFAFRHALVRDVALRADSARRPRRQARRRGGVRGLARA